MPIRLNSNLITSNKLNGNPVQVEKLNNQIAYQAVTWRAVAINEYVPNMGGLGNYYYHGTYTSSASTTSGSSKPRLAIKSDGSDYGICNLGTIFIYNGGPFPNRGSVLPTEADVGDTFFLNNGTLYIAE